MPQCVQWVSGRWGEHRLASTRHHGRCDGSGVRSASGQGQRSTGTMQGRERDGGGGNESKVATYADGLPCARRAQQCHVRLTNSTSSVSAHRRGSGNLSCALEAEHECCVPFASVLLKRRRNSNTLFTLLPIRLDLHLSASALGSCLSSLAPRIPSGLPR